MCGKNTFCSVMVPEMDDKNFRIFFMLLCPGSSAHLYGDGDLIKRRFQLNNIADVSAVSPCTCQKSVYPHLGIEKRARDNRAPGFSSMINLIYSVSSSSAVRD